jgi:rhodanese-related sulfurtransferase
MGVVILLLRTMLIPIPAPLKANSRVQDLKKRLDWGEPALTIIDVRNSGAFNTSHITGAVSIPLNQLVEQALVNLELVRDIYIYSSSDEETALAATLLKEAGYQNVAELLGGLAAWKAAGYPVEGNPSVIA